MKAPGIDKRMPAPVEGEANGVGVLGAMEGETNR